MAMNMTTSENRPIWVIGYEIESPGIRVWYVKRTTEQNKMTCEARCGTDRSYGSRAAAEREYNKRNPRRVCTTRDRARWFWARLDQARLNGWLVTSFSSIGAANLADREFHEKTCNLAGGAQNTPPTVLSTNEERT